MSASTLNENLNKAKKSLEDFTPRAGLFLKTGLGEELRKSLRVKRAIPCRKIPGFPEAFAENEIVFGEACGQSLMLLEGGPSYHQGIAMKDLAFPVWLLAKLGGEILVLTGAAGSLDARFQPGRLLLVEDHLNFMGSNPLIGIPEESLGPLFPDLAKAYDRALATLALRLARAEGVALKLGTLAATAGPALDTQAEKRFLRSAGAHAVATSLVPETVAAAHAGLRTLALVAITDSCWPRARQPVSVEEMLAAAEEAAPRLERLLRRVLEELPR